MDGWNETSSNKDIFDKSIYIYKDALKESGFRETLTYVDTNDNITDENKEEKKKRRRKIIWFNPPYSVSVKTNIDKTFLKLLSKHFPPNHSMHKIFNKTQLKSVIVV